MYFINQKDGLVLAGCEKCDTEINLRVYAFLRRVDDEYIANREVECQRCNWKSNKIINVSSGLQKKNELEVIRMEEEKKIRLENERIASEAEIENRRIQIKAELRPYEEFRDNVLNLYARLRNNEDVKSIIINFIQTLTTKLSSIDDLTIFENLLQQHVPIGKLLLNDIIDLEVIQLQQKMNAVDDYSNKFLRLVKFISNRYGVETDENSMYLSLLLIRDEVMRQQAEIFINEFGSRFNGINKSIDTYVKVLAKSNMININSKVLLYSFTSFLAYEGIVSKNIPKELKLVQELINEHFEDKRTDDYEKLLIGGTLEKKVKLLYTISDVDLMTGHEFEYFVADLFRKMGFSTIVTKGSGDQGIDVIAEKDDWKYGIQAKCYSSSITNKAIQEVVAGLNHYQLNKGIVVSNNYFTSSAVELANSNGVLLWDRNILKDKIQEYYKES